MNEGTRPRASGPIRRPACSRSCSGRWRTPATETAGPCTRAISACGWLAGGRFVPEIHREVVLGDASKLHDDGAFRRRRRRARRRAVRPALYELEVLHAGHRDAPVEVEDVGADLWRDALDDGGIARTRTDAGRGLRSLHFGDLFSRETIRALFRCVPLLNASLMSTSPGLPDTLPLQSTCQIDSGAGRDDLLCGQQNRHLAGAPRP